MRRLPDLRVRLWRWVLREARRRHDHAVADRCWQITQRGRR